MNREEILEKSRQENKNKDLVNVAVENEAFKIASIVLIAICTVYYVAEIMIKGVRNDGFFSIIAIFNAVICTLKGVRLKDKSFLFTGIFWIIFAIILTVAHISYLINTSTIL